MGIFARKTPLVGMVHLGALPGTPMNRSDLRELRNGAIEEAKLYQAAGFHGVMLENMHDRPYLKPGQHGPEVVAAFTSIATAVRQAITLPLGIQVLAGANREALAIAQASEAQFIRAESYVFGHLADEGWIDGCSGELLRYRKMIGADEVEVWADIKKKHSSHAVTGDLTAEEIAHATEFFLGDAGILTGGKTGAEANLDEIRRVRDEVGLPIWVGSGVNASNLKSYREVSNGLIIGTAAKENGDWRRPVSENAIRELVEIYEQA